MSFTRRVLLTVALVAAASTVVAAQDDPPPAAPGRGGVGQGRGGGRGTTTGAAPQDIRWRTPGVDRQVVDRGKVEFAVCAPCHGTDARALDGKTKVSLLHSLLVLTDDRKGTAMGAHLKAGHPTAGMGPILRNLTDAKIADLAEWLHFQIAVASERQNYVPLNVLVGDATAGEAYFNGAGGCASCHSPTGDLKGIGARQQPMNLQNAIVTGGGAGRGGARGGRGAAGPPGRAGPARGARTAAITLANGQTLSGTVQAVDPFLIVIGTATGETRSFFRNGDMPKVVLTDPMQGHLDLMHKYTDNDLHNLTAYLASLK